MNTPAPAATSPSRPTATASGSTAPTSAISEPGSKVVMAMNEDQFEREKLYQATMNMFQGMLKAGVITEEQYAIIDTKMLEKYRPLLGTLFSENACYVSSLE
jgi:hypothetical protein